MSRKTKRRQQVSSGRAWPWALAVVVIAAPAIWWLFTSQQSAVTSAGTPAGNASALLSAFRPPDLHALVVSPTDEQTIVFGHHLGMLVSIDGGATWTRVAGASGDAMGVALPPASKTAYAAGHNVFFRSDDGGLTWTSVRPALPGTDIHGFAASATTPGTFYAYVVGQGLFRSSDGGTSWSPIGNASGSTMSMAVAAANGSDLLYAATMEGVQRSRDMGRTWEAVPELRSATHVSATGSIVFAAADRTVLVSTDAGMSWRGLDFARGGAALVAVAPMNTRLVYIVTDKLEVWRSSDGGATWNHVG